MEGEQQRERIWTFQRFKQLVVQSQISVMENARNPMGANNPDLIKRGKLPETITMDSQAEKVVDMLRKIQGTDEDGLFSFVVLDQQTRKMLVKKEPAGITDDAYIEEVFGILKKDTQRKLVNLGVVYAEQKPERESADHLIGNGLLITSGHARYALRAVLNKETHRPELTMLLRTAASPEMGGIEDLPGFMDNTRGLSKEWMDRMKKGDPETVVREFADEFNMGLYRSGDDFRRLELAN